MLRPRLRFDKRLPPAPLAEIWCVSVEDSGTGLNPENTERIFDSFFTTKPQGTGMGLSISRSIIEGHQGRLWASPGIDQGTVFSVLVPAFRPADGQRPGHTGRTAGSEAGEQALDL
jgi:signal transduction histidine kinase